MPCQGMSPGAAELESRDAMKRWESDARPTPPGRCRECRWWVRQTDGIGACRRYPPVTAWGQLPGESAPRFLSAYPAVLRDDWCGEWKERDQ